MAVLFLAALAILLIAPGAISAETESEGATKEPAWSADMLVVEYTAVSIGAASADLFSNIGGSRDLKIKSLWSHVPSRDIRLAFQEGVSDVDDLTLIVGELTLEFPPGSSGNSSFKWTDVDVDWEDGETIPVSIVQTSAPEEPEEKEEPAANNPATGAPTISGTAQVGETLTAETSSIADEDGLDDVSYSYQWTRSNGSTYADLAGETGSTYTLVYADQGKTVKVKVSFTDDADNDETLTSEATEVVTAAPNRAATGEPTISGTPNVDQTLTAATSAIADDDGLTKVSYSYQWLANDGNSDADIEDATDSTYTLSVGDVGKTIKVSVLLHRRPEQRRGPDQRGDGGGPGHGAHRAIEPDRDEGEPDPRNLTPPGRPPPPTAVPPSPATSSSGRRRQTAGTPRPMYPRTR